MSKPDKNIKIPDFEYHCYGCGVVYQEGEEHNCGYAGAMLALQVLIVVAVLGVLFLIKI
jgi:rRNA maturation endonuclease Nob1